MAKAVVTTKRHSERTLLKQLGREPYGSEAVLIVVRSGRPRDDSGTLSSKTKAGSEVTVGISFSSAGTCCDNFILSWSCPSILVVRMLQRRHLLPARLRHKFEDLEPGVSSHK